jgi:hypothetical protein
VIDLPRPGEGSLPEADPGGALARTDRVLRLGLGVAWLAAACLGQPSLLGAPTLVGGALALLGLAALLDLAPRATALAGVVVSLGVLPGGTALAGWLAVVAAAGVRAVLWLGPARGPLARVRDLRRQRARQMTAMELRRAHAAALPETERNAELTRAGDAFEWAGRAGAELRAPGVGVRSGRGAARYVAPLLDRALPDGMRSALVQRLEARRP